MSKDVETRAEAIRPAIVSKETKAFIDALRTFNEGRELFYDALKLYYGRGMPCKIWDEFADLYEAPKNVIMKELSNCIDDFVHRPDGDNI